MVTVYSNGWLGLTTAADAPLGRNPRRGRFFPTGSTKEDVTSMLFRFDDISLPSAPRLFFPALSWPGAMHGVGTYLKNDRKPNIP